MAEAGTKEIEIVIQAVVEKEARARIDPDRCASEEAFLFGILDSQIVVLDAKAAVVTASADVQPSFSERVAKLRREILHTSLAGVADIAEGRFIEWAQSVGVSLMKFQVELDAP